MITRTLSAAALAFCLATPALTACDKDSGHGQKAAGHVESAVGSITGDEKLRHEGKKDEIVGGVKSAATDLKNAAKDAAH
jgi:uncharacterized protein YjbJ (UPF0337 family)